MSKKAKILWASLLVGYLLGILFPLDRFIYIVQGLWVEETYEKVAVGGSSMKHLDKAAREIRKPNDILWWESTDSAGLAVSPATGEAKFKSPGLYQVCAVLVDTKSEEKFTSGDIVTAASSVRRVCQGYYVIEAPRASAKKR